MKRSRKSRRNSDDDDYFPNQNIIITPAEKKSEARRQTNSNNKNAYAFLGKYAKKIWKLDAEGIQPQDIATAIIAENRLAKNSITGHQVSLWMYYKKKSKQGKPRSVSLKNKNLIVDNADNDCMYIFINNLPQN
jgi:hypothetical protein